jgi:branched-subunit amino acid aminotransferase/4-amino-4-deoxychorismate lyase
LYSFPSFSNSPFYQVLEIFGSGTAAVISPVSVINYKEEVCLNSRSFFYCSFLTRFGKDLKIPLSGKDGKAGKLAERIWKELTDIQVCGTINSFIPFSDYDIHT